MILSFAYRDTEALYGGERIRRFEAVSRVTQCKLDRLDLAASLHELGALPGNRPEKLQGDRAGQYSIRINDQYRLCLVWNEEAPGAQQVELVDYH